MRRNKKEASAPEKVSESPTGLLGFLKLLEDMEIKGESIRTGSGESAGPCGSKAVYDFAIKIGVEVGDFPFKRG